MSFRSHFYNVRSWLRFTIRSSSRRASDAFVHLYSCHILDIKNADSRSQRLHSNATALDAVSLPQRTAGTFPCVWATSWVTGLIPMNHGAAARARHADHCGNHDKAVTGIDATEDFNPVAKAADRLDARAAQTRHLAWLLALPHGLVRRMVSCSSTVRFKIRRIRNSPAQALDGLAGLHRGRHFLRTHASPGRFFYQDSQLEFYRFAPRQRNLCRAPDLSPRPLSPESRFDRTTARRDSRAAFDCRLGPPNYRFWRVPYDIFLGPARRNARLLLPEPLSTACCGSV